MFENLGGRLKHARQEAGLKQIYVGRQLGIGRCTVGTYEKGDRIPTSYVLRDLCVLYNVSADWLIFGVAYATLPQTKNLNIQDNIRCKLPPEIVSFEALGRYFGLSGKTIKRVITSPQSTQVRLLIKMAEKLNTTCDYLLFGAENTGTSQKVVKLPKSAEVWEHYKGGLYQVLHVANASAEDVEKFPLTVVYKNIETKQLWSRPWAEFKEKFVFKGWRNL